MRCNIKDVHTCCSIFNIDFFIIRFNISYDSICQCKIVCTSTFCFQFCKCFDRFDICISYRNSSTFIFAVFSVCMYGSCSSRNRNGCCVFGKGCIIIQTIINIFAILLCECQTKCLRELSFFNRESRSLYCHCLASSSIVLCWTACFPCDSYTC